MAYPTDLDSTTTIPVESASTPLSTNHVTNHTASQTAIIAIESKVGVDGSAVTTSHDYKLGEITSTDKAVGKTATQTLTNKTLTSPTVTGATITTSTLNGVTLQTAGSATDFLNAAGSYVNGAVTNASTTVAGLSEEATQAEVDAGTATGGTGARLFVNPSTIRTQIGGTGADGALTVSSGTTNIDLGSSAFVTKNYTSISITGTGKITFTNPHANGTIIVLKSTGDVTLTSSQTPMIDASSMGAIGGTGVSCIASASSNGNNGSTGLAIALSSDFGDGATTSAIGTGGNVATFSYTAQAFSTVKQNYFTVPVSSGGGSGMVSSPGGGGTSTSQNAGRGGGTLIIECARAWNFTTASGISVAGGSPSSGTTTGAGAAGGSGGGGGGHLIVVYGGLTANSGTVTVAGGSGSNKSSDAVYTAYGGGGGSSGITAGSNGTSSTTANAKTGGDGATGSSLITSYYV